MASQRVSTEKIVEVHIAEYQAITSRSSSLIIIASSIWPMLIVLLSVIAYAWTPQRSPYLVWSICAIGEFSLFYWAENSWQQMNNIRYIEKFLRPKLEVALSTQRFWHYEQYLHNQRTAALQWWEAPLPWAGTILLAGAVSLRAYSIAHSGTGWYSVWEVIPFCVNVALLSLVIRQSRRIAALRRDIFSSASGEPASEKVVLIEDCELPAKDS
jgi:hypothetical protein